MDARSILLYLVALVGLFCLVDCAGGTTANREGNVVDRTFVPAHTSYSTDSKGRIQSHYTPDDYTIVIRDWQGIKKVDTDAEGYYSVKLGQHITYQIRIGCLTGYAWMPSYSE